VLNIFSVSAYVGSLEFIMAKHVFSLIELLSYV